MTGRWSLELPDGLDDRAWWEAEARGVLLHVFLRHDLGRFPAIVYDAYRIVQDAEQEPFYEPNIVLVHAVTRESVRREVERLGRQGHLDWLLDLGPAPDAAWSLVLPEPADWALIRAHGTLSASLGHGEKRFPVTFFDLARLAAAVGRDEFDEKNVVVLPVLTEETVARAVDDLARRRAFDWLLGR